jgi:hypothetical protein
VQQHLLIFNKVFLRQLYGLFDRVRLDRQQHEDVLVNRRVGGRVGLYQNVQPFGNRAQQKCRAVPVSYAR